MGKTCHSPETLSLLDPGGSGRSRPWRSTVSMGVRNGSLGDTSFHHPSSKESGSYDGVPSCDRSWERWQRRTLREDATPVPVGRRGRTGIVSPPIRSHLAGSSEGLMPERIRSDLAHVGPGWSGAHEQKE